MPPSPSIRTPRIKDDDQIAFENGTSFEEACSYPKALEWYAEVKPTGGPWDMSASAGRVAILVALGRATEAVEIGQQAIQRMHTPNPELLGETARALNESGSPHEALQLCRRWVRHPANCQQPALWHSGAAYAALCGQFERSLRYLASYLHFCGGKLTADILLDRDLAPLWHHLENEARLRWRPVPCSMKFGAPAARRFVKCAAASALKATLKFRPRCAPSFASTPAA